MREYFDNRKERPRPLRQSSRSRFETLREWTFIFDPSSKRGSRWRFRILCLLALITAAFIYYIRIHSPDSAGPGIDGLLNKDSGGPGELLLRRE